MDSCFALIGARQHCVAKICNASQRANAHKLQNDPYSLAPRNTRCHITCFRAQGDQSVTIGVSKSKTINVAGQSQPKHLTAWPVPCFKTQRIGSERPTVRKYNRDTLVSLRPETLKRWQRLSYAVPCS